MTEPFKYRDENGGIRLDEILGEKDAAHYVRILTSSSAEFSAMQERVWAHRQNAYQGAEYEETPWRAEVIDDRYRSELVRISPYLPALASPCREVSLSPIVCWDVCGYYRRLGVRWRATNRELRLAYLVLDPRSEDGELHYALTQLLDPKVRRLYDQMGPTEVFLLDREVNAMIKRAAAREAARRICTGEDVQDASMDRVMREWGFYETTPQEARDTMQEAREVLARVNRPDREVGTALSLSGRAGTGWSRWWGYYAFTGWGGIVGDDIPGEEELEAWQAMVAVALSERGITTMFAVGGHESDSQIVLLDGNKACIFVTGKGASPEKAAEAVRAGVSQGKI